MSRRGRKLLIVVIGVRGYRTDIQDSRCGNTDGCGDYPGDHLPTAVRGIHVVLRSFGLDDVIRQRTLAGPSSRLHPLASAGP
jgi:hypothetical protein